LFVAGRGLGLFLGFLSGSLIGWSVGSAVAFG